MDDIFVGVGIARLVRNIPSQGLEERVYKLDPNFSLPIGLTAVGLNVLFEVRY